uniref:Secreted protein n=1 Tax=Achlya hypogyna TaxID=1202772 RepID=A0A0A7CP17_ACHHY|nr:secreted protein [Achlya hypogyna]
MPGTDLTTGSRLVLLLAVYDHVVDGVPARGTYQDVAVQFGVDRSLVSKLWKAHREYVIAASASGPFDIDAFADRLKTKRTGQSGRKPPDIKAIQATVAALPFEARTTYQSAAYHAGLSRSSLHRSTHGD